MGSRGLRRATLLLFLSSIILALFINNTALECNGEKKQKDGSTLSRQASQLPRTFLPPSKDTRNRKSTAYDKAEILRRFEKEMARRRPVEPSCSQANQNLTNFASVLSVGSIELGADSQRLSQAVRQLPNGSDLMVWTLTNTLPFNTSPSVVEALRALSEQGVGVVSLANELIISSHEEGVRRTTHHMKEAGLHWIGLTIRRDILVTVNGLRIGVLAYCAVYRECEDSGGVPLSPVKYSHKTAAAAVKSLKSRGADVVVVMVRWGRGMSHLPDETVLATARYLASLRVTLVIGSHPLLQQGHAYFEETLVIFSAGSFSRSSLSSQLCWQQREEGKLEYSQREHCQAVHPRLRSAELASEQQTSLYQIHLSRSTPPLAKYMTLPLSNVGNDLQLPRPPANEGLSWTRVCGGQDLDCLACHSL